jgi:hypothetical protein
MMAQLYPQDLGSLFIASYDSLGYGGVLRTRLHTGVNMIQSIYSLGADPQKTPLPLLLSVDLLL